MEEVDGEEPVVEEESKVGEESKTEVTKKKTTVKGRNRFNKVARAFQPTQKRRANALKQAQKQARPFTASMRSLKSSITEATKMSEGGTSFY